MRIGIPREAATGQPVVAGSPFNVAALVKLGYECLPSKTNFLFVKHPKLSGQATYQHLRESGILVRHFAKPRLDDFNRITIGTMDQMRAVVSALAKEAEAAQ